jgi:hypothetical protein
MSMQRVRSRDSSVNIALGYGQYDRGSIPVTGKRILPLLHNVQTSSWTNTSSYRIDTGGPFLGVKRWGREADHSTPPLMPRSRMVELYLHFPTSLHGRVLN